MAVASGSETWLLAVFGCFAVSEAAWSGIIVSSAYLPVFSVKPKFARFKVGFDIFYSDPSPL